MDQSDIQKLIGEMQKKNVQHALSGGRNFLQSWLDQLPIGIALLEGPNYTYTLCNKAVENIVGTSAMVVGKTIHEIFPPEIVQQHIKLLNDVYLKGQSHFLEDVSFKYPFPNGIIKDYYLKLTYQPLRTASGEIIGVIATAVDVTDRVLARKLLEAQEAELRRLKNQLSRAVKVAKIGFFEWNLEDNEVFVSDQLKNDWGLKTSSIPSQVCLGIIHPEDRGWVTQYIEACFAKRSPFSCEYRIIRPSDGKMKWIEVQGEIRCNSKGHPIQFFGTSIDISPQKRVLEALDDARIEAEKANSAKSAFLANMSHEIRTPLGAIMGFANLLKNEDLQKADVEKFLSVIDRNSTHLLRLIDDILDLSKVEAGRMQIETVEVALPELISEFCSVMEMRAKDKGISFKLKFFSQIPDKVISDPTRIRQILMNVVGNAIKFTEKGSVELLVHYSHAELEFAVRDTGCGISEEQAQGLFQAFHQADISTTRRFGGTGLGLVLTRKIAEAMGGTFRLERSVPNQGSLFVATIRVQMPEESQMVEGRRVGAVREEMRELPQRLLEGMKLLVVEDSEDNQNLFRAILEQAGAIVEIANDGSEGVSRALQNKYDLVLMDVQMPKMDGHEAARTLRTQQYNTPIVALTAHAMKEERDRAIESGFSEFLPKPIQKKTLLNMVSRYLH